MRVRLLNPVLVLALAAAAFGSGLFASPQPQEKRSKADADLSKIGHRDIGRGLDFYSLQHETELGKELAKQIDRSAKFVDDPEVIRYVDQIGQRVARNSDARMPVSFRVIDSDVAEAFTLPGGYQYVNRGLLMRVESEAELAGVLAHGIAHTALRSATKEATRGEIAQLATIPATIFVPNDGPVTVPQPAGTNFAIPLTSLKAKREEELAADYFGLQYVYVTGYDPDAYLNLMERVWPQVSPGNNRPDVFSASPPLPDRLQAMRKEIAAILPKRSDAVVSTPEFKDFQERVRAWKEPTKRP